MVKVRRQQNLTIVNFAQSVNLLADLNFFAYEHRVYFEFTPNLAFARNSTVQRE